MKLVAAIIKPFKLDDVREALHQIDIEGMNVEEVNGYSRQKGYIDVYSGDENVVEILPKDKV
ncbi:MAG: P-II family nitrogen regulator, partial [Gammaproteobacteria bacterium]|nr:P-II family nitrogen regulator [Gammaproteobacteria bacterium]